MTSGSSGACKEKISKASKQDAITEKWNSWNWCFLKNFFISFMIVGGDNMPSRENLTKLAESSFTLETIRILINLEMGTSMKVSNDRCSKCLVTKNMGLKYFINMFPTVLLILASNEGVC